eukprot:4043281-Amphidinium_carterae.1
MRATPGECLKHVSNFSSLLHLSRFSAFRRCESTEHSVGGVWRSLLKDLNSSPRPASVLLAPRNHRYVFAWTPLGPLHSVTPLNSRTFLERGDSIPSEES